MGRFLFPKEGMMPDETPGQEPKTNNTPQQPAPGNDTPPPATEPQTFSAEYVKELRSEAAKYRTELKAIKDELDTAKTERDKAAEAELAEQGKWKELAEKNAEKLTGYEAQAKQWQDTEATVKEILDEHRKSLPEAIGELLEAMPPIAQLIWLVKNQGKLQQPAQGQNFMGLAGFNPSTPNNVQETDAQRMARLARQSGQASSLFKP